MEDFTVIYQTKEKYSFDRRRLEKKGEKDIYRAVGQQTSNIINL